MRRRTVWQNCVPMRICFYFIDLRVRIIEILRLEFLQEEQKKLHGIYTSPDLDRTQIMLSLLKSRRRTIPWKYGFCLLESTK